MSEGWKEVSLAEISTKIGDGLHGTPKYDDSGKYYFINGNNLGNGKIYIYPTTNRISQIEYEKIKKELNDRTILLGINGTIGNLGFYNDEKVALGKSACYINLKNDVDKHYVRYVLEFSHFQNYAQLFATGSTIRNLGLKAIRNYKFNLPPIEAQRKIASILSGYDDLIENNLKRIKILEEMAQQTYEEWFVRMRFPGYETEVMNEETGLPEGWEKVRIQDLCTVSGGGTPSKVVDEYWKDGKVNWFTPTDLSKKNSLVISESGLKTNDLGIKKSSAKILQNNSFMMTSRATIGLFALSNKPFSTNQGFINTTPNNSNLKAYLLYNFKYRLDELMGLATGATFPELSKSKFKVLKINKPSESVLNSFEEFTSTTFSQLFNLSSQNQRLREARDLLLPRLMMGIVEV